MKINLNLFIEILLILLIIYSVGEFLGFATKIVAERTQPGQRQSVKQQDYLCHVYVRLDGLAGVVIADQEYPSRVAFTLLSKVRNQIHKKVTL